MDKGLRVIFFGTPFFAVPVLEELRNNAYDIVGVFTGHGPIELEAQKYGLRIFSPVSLKKDEEVLERFKLLNPDLCIVAAYGKIIPPSYLGVPKYGFLNVHPSLLPKYRGPSPIQTAILNGDKKTGASIMVVDEQVDHGPVLASQKFSISGFQFSNHDQLAKELFTLGGKLLIDTIPKYVSGDIKPKPQNNTKATFTKMFTREDGRIDWSKPIRQIHDQIRALNPNPGTWTKWQSRILNIKTTQLYDNGRPDIEPGTVFKQNDNIIVAAKDGPLILERIQLEGGKEMTAKAFANGHPGFINSKLE